jgi:hypothetical protein
MGLGCGYVFGATLGGLRRERMVTHCLPSRGDRT